MEDLRYRYKRCIVCKKKIERDSQPWSKVTITGDEVFWHVACDKETGNG